MTRSRQLDWFFYPAWVFLPTVCALLAILLYLVIVRVIILFVGGIIYVDGIRHVTEDYLLGYIFYPTVSVLVGTLQYLVLRRYLSRLEWWMPITSLSWLVGIVLATASFRLGATVWLGGAANEEVARTSAFFLFGTIVGVAQWMLLRRWFSHAGWWILANVLGWGLWPLLAGDAFDLFTLLVFGILPGCVTAVTFALIMNENPSVGHPA